MGSRPRTTATGMRLPAPDDARAVREAVLAWYDAEGRTLPFRGTRDPWGILVSEAMAQQTQAARAGEAWMTFMTRFPTPAVLAAASPAGVLRAWRGLGYNRRALALRAAAAAIVADHAGVVPEEPEVLRRLPGVGPYTARAVAALAFGRPVGAVDTNVRRVLSRFAPGSTARPRDLQAFADALVDPLRPGDWTHALMDVGAGICRIGRPDCAACPLARWCATAREEGGSDQAATATRGGRGRSLGERAAPYASTTRWLRGRLVDRLRDAPDLEWVRVADPIGDHDAAAVRSALAALERDGLLERHPQDEALARLPPSAAEPGAAR